MGEPVGYSILGDTIASIRAPILARKAYKRALRIIEKESAKT